MTILIPASGLFVASGEVTLSWYLAPGAESYRVQVARDRDFTSLVLDRFVDRPPVTVTLGPGVYFWRVQALFPGGSIAELSDPSELEAVPEDDPRFPSEPVEEGTPAEGRMFIRMLKRRPPRYDQRKDSPLLTLESNRPSDDSHPWDGPHPELDEDDPADATNCAPATISMMNGYYAEAGDDVPALSQDRIGLAVFSSPGLTIWPGPEIDFNFGRGFHTNEWVVGLKFALGVQVEVREIDEKGLLSLTVFGNYDEVFRGHFWDDLLVALKNGNPVPCGRSTDPNGRGGHASLAWGAQEIDGRRMVYLNDPWHAKIASGWMLLDELLIWKYFLIPDGATVTPRRDEEEIGKRVDSDGDRLLDFDERERFGTRYQRDPADRDTDADCTDDYTEVKRSVFDERHGWGHYLTRQMGGPAPPSDGYARRFGKPELVPDTDGGGVPSGSSRRRSLAAPPSSRAPRRRPIPSKSSRAGSSAGGMGG